MRKSTFFYITFCLLSYVLIGCKSKKEESNKKTPDEIIEENLGETLPFDQLSDTLQVAHMVRVWNGYHDKKFIDKLIDLYAPSLFFYGEKRTSSAALSIKHKVLDTYPGYFQRIIGGIKISKISPDEYRANFTKYVSVDKITAPVPSYLIFKKVADNDWKIIAESDPTTDFKVKELKDSLEVLSAIYAPSQEQIKGHFLGTESDTLYILAPENPECTDCTTSIFSSNEKLPPIEIKGVKTAQLMNEGDLDGDGYDEFSSLTKSNGQGFLAVYTFKRGEWKILKKFKVNYDNLISNTQSRNDAIRLAGAGYIYIQVSDADTTRQEKINIWNY